MPDMAPALMPGKALSKVPTKAPTKDSVKSKVPSKVSSQMPSTALMKSPMKALDASKVPSAPAPSKVPPSAGSGSKVPVSKPVAKKASVTHTPVRLSSKLPPQRTTAADAAAAAAAAVTPVRGGNGADGAAHAEAEMALHVTPPVVPSPSEATTNGTEHFATYDEMLSPVETPREQPREMDQREQEEQLQQKLTTNELIEPLVGKQVPHGPPQPKAMLQKQGLRQKEVEEEEGQIADSIADKGEASLLPSSLITTHSPPTAKTVMRGADLEQDLVKAEERIGKLTQELEALRKALLDTDDRIFVQRSFLLEGEVEELKRELAKERDSTRYYREAHMNSLMELGSLQQKMDFFGTHTTLMKRNEELEAKASDMAREKVEQELMITQMQEDAAALGLAHGNSGFGSGYVTVRLSGLCTSCRDKILNEADRRAARDRLSQLVQPKIDGPLPPPSLAEHWPPELQRRLLEKREDPPPLCANATVKGTNAFTNSALSHGTNCRDKGKDESFGKGKIERWENAQTAKYEGHNTASSVWRETQTSDGRILYYNTLTNSSTYERPAALM